MEDLTSLKRKVSVYQEILSNTIQYRERWKTSLKSTIKSELQRMLDETALEGEIEVKEDVTNLEAIVLNLGQEKSGIYEKINEEVNRPLIKHNGSLVYQQLFNGKVITMITYPVIEGYGEPRPPRTIAIYRPEEIKPPFLIRHMEEFIREVTEWEDYDDDDKGPSQKIGYSLNFMPQDEGGEG
jgi:hypothetical protein